MAARQLWPLVLFALIAWDPAAPALLPKLAAVSLLALVGAAWLGYRGGFISKYNLLDKPLLVASLAVLLGCVSLGWGSPAGRLSQATSVATLCLAWAARGLFTTEDLRGALVSLARWLGAALGAWALLSYAAGQSGAWLHAGMGNPNWLGLCLALTLTLSWPPWSAVARVKSVRLISKGFWGFGKALRQASKAPRTREALGTTEKSLSVPREALQDTDEAPSGQLVSISIYFASALQLTGLVLAESRVAWIACLVAAAYAVMRRRWRSAAARARLAWLAPVLALAPVMAGFGATPVAGEGLLGALAGRRAIWHAATLAWAEAPLGVGSGDFSAAFLWAQGKWLAGYDAQIAARAFQHAETAHSSWLMAWVEQGPVGGALLVLWLWLALRRAAWARGVTALVAVGTCAIADSALELPAVAALAWLTTAALGTAARGTSEDEAPGGASGSKISSRESIAAPSGAHGWLRRGAPWLLLALAALTLREATLAWRAERSASYGRTHPEARLEAQRRAAQLYPSSAALQLELGVAQLSAGDALGALEAAEESSRTSVSVASELLRAKAQTELGRLPEARRALESAAALSPGSFRVHLGLAAVTLELGDLEACQRALDRARAVQPFAPEVEPLTQRLRQARADSELH
ncbi:MAG: O-antigen ligase family protein [Polyangiaceae bacterium]|nr:O-antigen ligase family protein [Polyangiaceae bacterium]MCW5789702.1 O-antigen ligase family protein [Polyangiaceae bacterium]